MPQTLKDLKDRGISRPSIAALSSKTPDLEACAREAIQIPGAVQPHGVLIAIDAEDRITHVSESCGDLLGMPAPLVIGRPLGVLFDEASIARLKRAFELPAVAGTLSRTKLQPSTTALDVRREGWNAHAAVHTNGSGVRIIEVEPGYFDDPEVFQSLTTAVQAGIADIAAARTPDGVMASAVKALAKMTGYHRVMGYLFDAEFNGRVVAEVRAQGEGAWRHSFLGLHFPASDIPAQARRLYMRKRLRLIADINYVPSAILAVAPASAGSSGAGGLNGAGGVNGLMTEPPALDLSDAELRAISPVHIEYMQNMGVGATLVLSLMSDDRLIGMLVCHHYGPRQISPHFRDACALLADVTGTRVGDLERLDIQRRHLDSQRSHVMLLDTLSRQPRFATALTRYTHEIARLATADGVAVMIGEHTWTSGFVPQLRDLRELAAWLREQEDLTAGAFVTDHLVGKYPPAGRFLDVAAGILAVRLRPDSNDCVIWFRSEVARTVTWAGDPNKPVEQTAQGQGGQGQRLSPRKSFDAFLELVRGHSPAWQPWEVEIAAALRGTLTNVVIQFADLLRQVDERCKAEGVALRYAEELEQKNKDLESARLRAEEASAAKSLFLGHVSHELRTPLTAILGYTKLLVDADGSPETPMEPAERADFLATVHRNGEHLLQVVSDMLEAVQVESSGTVTVAVSTHRVGAMVEDSVGAVSPQAQARGLTVEVVPLAGSKAGADEIETDAKRFRQVLINLLSNSVKFTERGGITVAVGRGANGSVIVEVRDSGQGLTPEQVGRLFTPFQQGDPSYTRRHGGVGLGLFLARRIARALGGDVEYVGPNFELGAGGGAVFRATFAARASLHVAGQPAPMAPTTEASATRAERVPVVVPFPVIAPAVPVRVPPPRADDSPTPGANGETMQTHTHVVGAGESTRVAAAGSVDGTVSSGGTARDLDAAGPALDAAAGGSGPAVLIVEDALDLQRLLRIMLLKAGFNVAVRADGRQGADEALRAQAAGRPYRLILMDLQLPVLDGYSAVAELRSAGYTGQIVAVSAHAGDSARDKTATGGFDDFLAKPLNVEKLRSKLASLR